MQFNKKIITVITISLTIVLVVGVLFLPFINLNFSVFKNQPGTNRNTVVTTKFDLFKPRLSILIPNGNEGYLVSIADYERENIFFFKEIGLNGKPKPIDGSALNARIESQDINTAKSLASKYDLSLVNPDEKLVTNGIRQQQSNEEKKLEDAEKVENRAYDKVGLIDFDSTRSLNEFINKFTLNEMSDSYYPLFSGSMGKKGILGFGTLQTFSNEDRYQETQIRITENPRVSFIALKEKCGKDSEVIKCSRAEYNNIYLKAINIVLKDRTIIPVPIKPDGTFDFEAVRNKWE